MLKLLLPLLIVSLATIALADGHEPAPTPEPTCGQAVTVSDVVVVYDGPACSMFYPSADNCAACHARARRSETVSAPLSSWSNYAATQTTYYAGGPYQGGPTYYGQTFGPYGQYVRGQPVRNLLRAVFLP